MEKKSLIQRINSFLRGENAVAWPDERESYDIPTVTDQSPKEVNSNHERSYNIEVVKPQTIDEAKEIANQMIAGTTLILNLQALNEESAKEMLYFVSGVCHALEGNIEKVYESIFLYTPKHINIRNNHRELLRVTDHLRVVASN